MDEGIWEHDVITRGDEEHYCSSLIEEEDRRWYYSIKYKKPARGREMGTAGRPAIDCSEFKSALHLCGSETLARVDRPDPGWSVEALAGIP